MNDPGLEEALRDELNCRVAAIDREVSLLELVAHRVRRLRRRRRIVAAASAMAVVTGAAVTGAVVAGAAPTVTRHAVAGGGWIPALGDHGGPRLYAGLETGNLRALSSAMQPPSGWAPVAYLGAQVFVPATWSVETDGRTVCGGRAGGVVFLGTVPGQRAFTAAGCRPAANVVTLVEAAAVYRAPVYHGPARVMGLNNTGALPAYVVRVANGAVVYDSPGLGVRVRASGPLAARVLATLSRSPRSLALAGGPLPSVPAGWRWHAFGGIAFAAPATWAVERDSWWGGCPDGISAATVRLSTAANLSVPGCGEPPSFTAGSQAARPGVVVGAGRYAAADGLESNDLTRHTPPRCMRLRGMRVCVVNTAFDSMLLELAVFGPRATSPTLVEIGLAGTGATARAIFGSLRPATPPASARGLPQQLPRPPR